MWVCIICSHVSAFKDNFFEHFFHWVYIIRSHDRALWNYSEPCRFFFGVGKQSIILGLVLFFVTMPKIIQIHVRFLQKICSHARACESVWAYCFQNQSYSVHDARLVDSSTIMNITASISGSSGKLKNMMMTKRRMMMIIITLVEYAQWRQKHGKFWQMEMMRNTMKIIKIVVIACWWWLWWWWWQIVEYAKLGALVAQEAGSQ